MDKLEKFIGNWITRRTINNIETYSLFSMTGQMLAETWPSDAVTGNFSCSIYKTDTTIIILIGEFKNQMDAKKKCIDILIKSGFVFNQKLINML